MRLSSFFMLGLAPRVAAADPDPAPPPAPPDQVSGVVTDTDDASTARDIGIRRDGR